MDAFGICIESKSRPLDRLRVRLGRHLGYLPRTVRLTWLGLAWLWLWLAGLAGTDCRTWGDGSSSSSSKRQVRFMRGSFDSRPQLIACCPQSTGEGSVAATFIAVGSAALQSVRNESTALQSQAPMPCARSELQLSSALCLFFVSSCSWPFSHFLQGNNTHVRLRTLGEAMAEVPVMSREEEQL